MKSRIRFALIGLLAGLPIGSFITFKLLNVKLDSLASIAMLAIAPSIMIMIFGVPLILLLKPELKQAGQKAICRMGEFERSTLVLIRNITACICGICLLLSSIFGVFSFSVYSFRHGSIIPILIVILLISSLIMGYAMAAIKKKEKP